MQINLKFTLDTFIPIYTFKIKFNWLLLFFKMASIFYFILLQNLIEPFQKQTLNVVQSEFSSQLNKRI